MTYCALIRQDNSKRFSAAENTKLAKLEPIALFCENELSNRNEKEKLYVDHANIACSMYKLLTTPRGHHDSSIRFARDILERAEKRITMKRIRGKFHNTILIKDVFGFAEHQQYATFGLSYKLTLKTKNNYTVLSRNVGTVDGQIAIFLTFYVLHCTRNVIQQGLLKEKINKKPTELC